MEENLLTPAPESNDAKGCVNCGNSNIIEGYPTALCSDCRQAFIKYPIPLGIKIFAAAVGVILVLSVFTFPKHIAMALHLERGKRFEKNHAYRSAQQEFDEVLKKQPNNAEAAGRMAIAAFYNMDFEQVAKLGPVLRAAEFDDHELFVRVDDIATRLHEYIPGDSLESFLNQFDGRENGVPDSAFHKYFTKYPDDLYGQITYANVAMDKKNYALCDSILNVCLDVDEEYLPALRLLASSQREQGQQEEAIKTCDKMIGINRDAATAYALKSRIYLEEKKDALALELAKKSVALDQNDPYNNATLALAYFYNNMASECDGLIREARAKKDSSAMYYMQYVVDVIDQKEKFRN